MFDKIPQQGAVWISKKIPQFQIKLTIIASAPLRIFAALRALFANLLFNPHSQIRTLVHQSLQTLEYRIIFAQFQLVDRQYIR